MEATRANFSEFLGNGVFDQAIWIILASITSNNVYSCSHNILSST